MPVKGFPRITRPRPRKNADGLSGFSLVDPAGNWIRFFNRKRNEEMPRTEVSRLGEVVQNAVVLADSKGDVAQATKVLQGALSRAPADDPSREDAREFLAELTARQDNA